MAALIFRPCDKIHARGTQSGALTSVIITSNKETEADDGKCQACHGTGSVAGASPVKTGPFLLNPSLCRVCGGTGRKPQPKSETLAARRKRHQRPRLSQRAAFLPAVLAGRDRASRALSPHFVRLGPVHTATIPHAQLRAEILSLPVRGFFQKLLMGAGSLCVSDLLLE